MNKSHDKRFSQFMVTAFSSLLSCLMKASSMAGWTFAAIFLQWVPPQPIAWGFQTIWVLVFRFSLDIEFGLLDNVSAVIVFLCQVYKGLFYHKHELWQKWNSEAQDFSHRDFTRILSRADRKESPPIRSQRPDYTCRASAGVSFP